MDEVTYQSLAKPSTEKGVVYYRLADKGLYDQIVMKYMHGNLPKNPDSITTQDHKNHSMHDMEGM
jgi:hypothetical protein